MNDRSKYLAEAIATFALVFIGGGAVLMNSIDGALGLAGVALAHGMVLMAMIYATGHISGAHINPAVTIGMLVTKNIKPGAAVGYIVSQLGGASLAGLLILLVLPDVPEAHLGVPKVSASISSFAAVGIEAILTFFLVFVIFGTAVDKKAPAGFYGLAIGFVLIFAILVGGSLTGASMNPARTFGPALISGYWTQHWVYWIGPIAGGIIGALVYSKGI